MAGLDTKVPPPRVDALVALAPSASAGTIRACGDRAAATLAEPPMKETRFDLSTMRHLRGATEVGTARDGQAVVMRLQMEDGSAEWLAMHHARVGQLVASVLFASGAAAESRREAAGQGKAVDDGATLVDIVRVNAASAPGADHIALRVVIGEGANLDFRIPLEVVPALQEKIAQAAATAGSSAG